jgi:hypothetical protein
MTMTRRARQGASGAGRNESGEPRVPLGPANDRRVMPLGRQWGERPTAVVVDLPEGPIGPKKPHGSDGAHDRDAAVPRGLVVDVPTQGRGAGDDISDLLRDVLGKDHPRAS